MAFPRKLVRFSSFTLAALLSGAALAGVIPGTDGKLDFGLEGIDVPDPIVRNKTSPRTVTLLVDAATSEAAPFRRAQLVSELGTTHLVEAIAPLIKFLADPAPEVRATAAGALGRLAGESSLAAPTRAALQADQVAQAALRKLTSDQSPTVRVEALRALVAIAGPDQPELAAAISSNDDEVLAAAIDLAQTTAQGEAIAKRLPTLPAELRSRAIRAIGRCKTAHDQLVALLESQNVSDAVAAAAALAHLAQQQSLAPLMKATAAEHPVLRREALRTYSAIAPADARIQLAVTMLKDSDATVRQIAAEAMGTDLRPELVPLLVAQLSDDYRPLYLAARAALISAKNDPTRQAAINAAGELLDHADPRRREDGSYILGQYRSDHRLDRHIELVRFDADSDFRVVAQAAESLGMIGRKEPREAIVTLVKAVDQLKTNGPASDAVAKALVAAGRLGFDEVLPVCARIIPSDPMTGHLGQKEAASFAVGMLAKPDAQVVQTLYVALNSPMDANKNESVKALGNLKVKGAETRIQAFPMSDTPPTQWLIQWATARITGQPAQHPPMVSDSVASTTYRDLRD